MIETRHLVGDTNDTTGRAGSGVASLERLLVAALSKVVGATVDDDSSLGTLLALPAAVRLMHRTMEPGEGINIRQ